MLATSSSSEVSTAAAGLIPAESCQLTIEVGRARLTLSEMQSLRPGVVVSLEEFLNDPVTVYVGSRLAGRGELLVVDGHFGVRLTELYRPRNVN